MSYSINLYEPQFLRRAISENLGDWSCATPLPEAVIEAVREKLEAELFTIESPGPIAQEWIHPKTDWGLQVSVFRTEIAFVIPYWDDWENAVMFAESIAKDLAASTGLGYYDQQSGETLT
jgi:hypothetical protein